MPNDLPDPSNLDPNPIHHLNTPTAPHSQNPLNYPTPPVQITQKNEAPRQRRGIFSLFGGAKSAEVPLSGTKADKYSEKADPPLVDIKVTNPVTYFKKWLGKLLKNQDIDIRIKIKPFATLALIAALSATFGLGYNFGLKSAVQVLFPNSSPLLHRSITLQGTIQKSSKGEYFLKADDKSLWTLKSVSSNVNLADYVDKQVQIKGNLTPTPNLIDVSEVISFNAKPTPTPLTTPAATLYRSEATGAEPNLPKLYSNLTWEVTQSKTLLFTSGKRRIEQEGVYLESAQVDTYPQAFFDYYTQELTNANFKQTLNSSKPDGTTITYAKDELFLTFGVKNVFSGSGDNKKVVGYKAYIEHN